MHCGELWSLFVRYVAADVQLSHSVAMVASLMTGFSLSNQTTLDNTTAQNSTSGDVCNGAGTFSDGTCKTIWPFWVEVTVPLCCILIFLLTLAIVYLRPVGSRDEDDACKQQLKTSDGDRTEPDQTVSYKRAGETSLDTKV